MNKKAREHLNNDKENIEMGNRIVFIDKTLRFTHFHSLPEIKLASRTILTPYIVLHSKISMDE